MAALLSRCLRAQFPDAARSENALCHVASVHLDCAPETVRQMLRSGDGKLSLVGPVLAWGAACGVDVAGVIFGGQS